MLLGDAVQVLAVDAGISAEPEGLREIVVERRLLEEVHRRVHPEDEVAEERVEVERYLVGFEVGMPGDALEPEKEGGAVLAEQPPGLGGGGGGGIRRAGHVFSIALAPEPALEPHPLRDDDVMRRYPPRFRAPLPCKGGELLDLLFKFASHRASPR